MSGDGAPRPWPAVLVYRVWRGIMAANAHPKTLVWEVVDDLYDRTQALHLVAEIQKRLTDPRQIVFLIVTEHQPADLPTP